MGVLKSPCGGIHWYQWWHLERANNYPTQKNPFKKHRGLAGLRLQGPLCLFSHLDSRNKRPKWNPPTPVSLTLCLRNRTAPQFWKFLQLPDAVRILPALKIAEKSMLRMFRAFLRDALRLGCALLPVG